MEHLQKPVAALIALDPEFQEIIASLLEKNGYSCVAAESLETLQEQSAAVRVVISAVEAPELEGLRICRLLRSPAHANLREIPLLLLSRTLTGPAAREAVLAAGGDDFIGSPVDPGQVLKTVLFLSSRKGSSRPATSTPYDEFFLRLPDACALHETIFDSAGNATGCRFLALNPGFERITGLRAADLVGRNAQDIFAGSDPFWADIYRRASAADTRLMFDSGPSDTGKHFSISVFPVGFGRYASTFRDITRQADHERNLNRLANLQAVIGLINQAVVRANTRKEMFEEICRISAEMGHFRLASVGFRDAGTGDVKFTGRSCSGSDSAISIEASECKLVKSAIAEGRTVVRNDDAADPTPASCDPHGTCSCAALPIRCNDEVCGALCFHASSPGFFGPSELRILEDEAANVSFALDKFLAEEQREQVSLGLRRSEERLNRLFDHMLEGLLYCRVIYDNGNPVDFEYLATNPAFERLTGLRDIIGRRIGHVIPGFQVKDAELFARLSRIAATGKPERFETYVRSMRMWVSISAYCPEPGFLTVMFDVITDRKETDIALRESEAKFSRTFQHAPIMMSITSREDNTILDVNERFLSALGLAREDVIGKTWHAAGLMSLEYWTQIGNSIRSDSHSPVCEIALRGKEGRPISCEHAGELILIAGRQCMLSAMADITERKQHESERESMLQLLRILNAPNDLRQLIHNVTGMLQNWCGCDAVGVRLEDGEDYPYFETRGFTSEFVEMERSLCASGRHDEIVRDADGKPVMECMCGSVLTGTLDASLPFCTENGSLWMNSADSMLSVSAMPGIRGRARHICIRSGYQSMALIPLRANGVTLGLLQLNDRRTGQFTTEMISFLESFSGSLAIALEQRRTQERLRESREEYRLVADHTYSWEFWLGPDGVPRYHSPACKRITGYPASDFMQRPALLDEIVHPDDRQLFRQHVHSSDAPEPGPMEFRVRTCSGEEKIIEHVCRPVYDDSGRYLGYRGSNRDITSRRLTQQQLAESERRFREMLGNVDLLAMMLDTAGKITFCNDHLLNALGWERQEIIGKNWFEYCLPKSIGEEIRLVFDEGIETGELPKRHTNPVLTHSGHERLFVWYNTTLRSPDGDVVGTASIGRDVTEQRLMEEQLRQAQKLESIGRLAGGVAHDFNNLLTVINGYSDILLTRTDRRDPVHKPVAEIRKAGERAADLTRQLLTFSRRQVINPKPVDLNRLISDSRGMLERLISEDIELVTDLGTGLGEVFADPGQLHQVLMNLVVNARDAMPAGGRLTIETTTIEAGKDSTETHPEVGPGEYVLMMVTDTGIGMSEEIRARIFEPFFTTKGEGRGTGLGLATVYGIVRQCDGWIDVASTPGVGTTFSIGIPRATGSERNGAETTPAETNAGSGTILVVEDQQDVRKYASIVLKSYGYEVMEAQNGAQALAMAREHPGAIDLVLTDVVMPGMTGREVAERLRNVAPDIRVVYMSGYTDDVIARRGILDENVDYIAKPFSPEALAGKIRSALDSPAAKKVILVADDDPGIRELFSGILVEAGYEVIEAGDGDEVLRLMDQRRFDLMLLDLVMPNREGLETIQLARQKHSGVKIIAISGAFGGSFLKVAQKLGADATLTKPVAPEQLLDSVKSLLP